LSATKGAEEGSIRKISSLLF